MSVYPRDYWQTPPFICNCRCRVSIKAAKPVFEQSSVRTTIGGAEVVVVQTVIKQPILMEDNPYYIKSAIVRFFEVYPEVYAGHESIEWFATYDHENHTLTTMAGKCYNVTSMGDAVETLRECLMLDTPLEDL